MKKKIKKFARLFDHHKHYCMRFSTNLFYSKTTKILEQNCQQITYYSFLGVAGWGWQLFLFVCYPPKPSLLIMTGSICRWHDFAMFWVMVVSGHSSLAQSPVTLYKPGHICQFTGFHKSTLKNCDSASQTLFGEIATGKLAPTAAFYQTHLFQKEQDWEHKYM